MLGAVPYSPLGRGFLTGSIDETTKFIGSDNRGSLPRFAPEARKANRPLVTLLEDVGHRKGATAGADRACVAAGAAAVGRADPGHHEAEPPGGEFGAASIELTPGDLRHIEDAAKQITIQGDRYPQAVEALLGR